MQQAMTSGEPADKSLIELLGLVQQYPDNAACIYTYIDTLKLQDQREPALKLCDEAIESFPRHSNFRVMKS